VRGSTSRKNALTFALGERVELAQIHRLERRARIAV
jgi:hypothetical protein